MRDNVVFNKTSQNIQEIPTSELYSHPECPYQVNDDNEMMELVANIAENGLDEPIKVRTREIGGYEIVSGQRRKRAFELLGMSTIPSIIEEIDDEAAIIKMINSNLKRTLLPSEKAFSYKIRLDAMKRKAGRPSKNNSAPVDLNCFGMQSREILAQSVEESAKQIQRYIRLTHLNSKLLVLVDKRKIKFNTAVELSYLDDVAQCWIYEFAIKSLIPSLTQAAEIRNLSKMNKLTKKQLETMLADTKEANRAIPLQYNDIKQYFPDGYSTKQIQDKILKLLDNWFNKRG